jgi:hypothetical protein
MSRRRLERTLVEIDEVHLADADDDVRTLTSQLVNNILEGRERDLAVSTDCWKAEDQSATRAEQ